MNTDFQVIHNKKTDDFEVVLIRDDTKTVIASHPNGYTCHRVVENLRTGDYKASQKFLDYVVACGGTALNIEQIINLTNYE